MKCLVVANETMKKKDGGSFVKGLYLYIRKASDGHGYIASGDFFGKSDIVPGDVISVDHDSDGFLIEFEKISHLDEFDDIYLAVESIRS